MATPHVGRGATVLAPKPKPLAQPGLEHIADDPSYVKVFIAKRGQGWRAWGDWAAVRTGLAEANLRSGRDAVRSTGASYQEGGEPSYEGGALGFWTYTPKTDLLPSKLFWTLDPPASVHGGGRSMAQDVSGLFDSIAHAFKHIAHDVARRIGPALGPMFGLPPEAVAALSALALKAHAGDPHAKARVRELAAHGTSKHDAGAVKAALQRISKAVQDHPHFGNMKADAHRAIRKATAA